jgi:hypothetical protein
VQWLWRDLRQAGWRSHSATRDQIACSPPGAMMPRRCTPRPAPVDTVAVDRGLTHGDGVELVRSPEPARCADQHRPVLTVSSPVMRQLGHASEAVEFFTDGSMLEAPAVAISRPVHDEVRGGHDRARCR